VPNPGLQDHTDKRAGLEPEEFQRRLIAVTAIVLTLGIVGGTCLGMKIEKAEQLQQSNAAPQQQSTPVDQPGNP